MARLYHVLLGSPIACKGGLAATLSPREQAQYEAFCSERRKRDWLAGRLAAKKLIIEDQRARSYSGLKPAEIEITYGPRGEPQALVRGERLKEISLSIAHSCGHGLAGLSHLSNEGCIGVDVERIRSVHPRLAERFLSPEELEQLQAHFPNATEGVILHWTLKEAALKALRPLMASRPSLRQLHVRLAEQPGRAYITLLSYATALEAHYRRKGESYLAFVLAPITSKR